MHLYRIVLSDERPSFYVVAANVGAAFDTATDLGFTARSINGVYGPVDLADLPAS